MSGRVYGIHLGMTNSSIAYVNDLGEADIIINREGEKVTPSVVYFEENDLCVVGDLAKEMAYLEPERTCSFVLKGMGKNEKFFKVENKEYSPEQIAALILKKLVCDAEKAVGEEIKDVVITYPGYFDAAERAGVIAAGEMAGLNVLDTVSEPTAAMCYDYTGDAAEKNILIYDLGGASFEASVMHLEVSDSQLPRIHEIAEISDLNLGGKEWDQVLVDYLIEQFRREKDFHKDFDAEDVKEIYIRAERAKRQLTAKTKTNVIVSAAGEYCRIELTREKFEELSAHLLERTFTQMENLLCEVQRRGIKKVDEIYLIGGSCRMTQVVKKMEEVYPDIPIKAFGQELVLAKGAAKYGSILEKNVIVPPVLPGLVKDSFADKWLELSFTGRKSVEEPVAKTCNQWEITDGTKFQVEQRKQGRVDKVALTMGNIRFPQDKIVEFTFDIKKEESFSAYSYQLFITESRVEFSLRYVTDRGIEKIIRHEAKMEDKKSVREIDI